VVSTMNVQHLESVTPWCTRSRSGGARDRSRLGAEAVDEIVLADVTPEALQTRMRRGDIYPMERVDRALGSFFRPSNLIALREIALRHVAQVVDRSLEPYMDGKPRLRTGPAGWGTHCCRDQLEPGGQYLVARASRMAQAINGELFAV